jgi:sugar lactone lactonase YvrE
MTARGIPILSLALTAALVSGCAVRNGNSPLPGTAFADLAHVPSSWTNLYVANSGNDSVTVYAPKASTPLRMITEGIHGPTALAFDHAGNLYVANYKSSTVTVDAKGSTTLLRVISRGVRRPVALAFDSSGNLYVADQFSRAAAVTVYAPGSTTPLRTIKTGVYAPTSLAFDKSGRLYVANGNSTVTIYRPHSPTEIRRITQGINEPDALAVDGSNNLYVSNSGNETVTVYPEGVSSPQRTLQQMQSSENSSGTYGTHTLTDALTLGSSGDLYVATATQGWEFSSINTGSGGVIYEYAPGGTKPRLVITSGLAYPTALAIGPSGAVYVANDGSYGSTGGPVVVANVAMYAATATKPSQSIEKGIDKPTALAFGP